MDMRKTFALALCLTIMAVLAGFGPRAVAGSATNVKPGAVSGTGEVAAQTGALPSSEGEDGFGQDTVSAQPKASNGSQTEIDLSGCVSFTAFTPFGESVDSSVFADYELTMINIWGTLCKPCIEEMPDIERLYEEVQPQGVNVIGFIANYQEDRVEKARLILEKAGVIYTNIVFDDVTSGAISAQISGFPTTIFVDSAGIVVGEQVSGARSYSEYKELIAERLEASRQ